MKPSQNRAVLALLALALLVALGLFWRRDGEVVDTASAPAPAELAEPHKTSPAPPEAIGDSSEPSRESPREEPATEAALPTRDGLFRVRVLHFETLEPLAGAEVRWIEADRLRDPNRTPFVLDPDVEKRWAEHGQVATSDARGEVAFEPSAEYLRFEANFEELVGCSVVSRADQHGARVLLRPNEDLRVEVLDADGRPAANVGVTVLAGGRTGAALLPQAMTGPDGRARLKWVREHVLEGGEGPLRVAACIVGVTPVERLLDSRPWPAGSLQLQLPPTGSMHFRCVDSQGALVEDPLLVSVSGRFFLAEHGEVELPWVEVMEFVGAMAQTFPPSPFRVCNPKVLPAPRFAGERVEVELVLGDIPFLLAGRALRPEGAPLIDAPVELIQGATPHGLSQTRTDAEGRFELALQIWPNPQRGPLALHATSLSLEAPLELGDKPDQDRIWLGDVPLVELPQLVAGRVLDPDGRGIEGAVVGVEARPRDFDLSAFAQEPGFNIVEWPRDPRASARTDRDGRFVLRRKFDDFALRLSVGAKGFLRPEPLPVSVDGPEVEIVLQRAVARLVGHVKLASQDAAQHLRLRCRGAKAEWRGSRRFEVEREGDGPVDLEIWIDGESLQGAEPILRLEGLRGPDDPRLSDIDLRPLLHEFRFEILAPPRTRVGDLTISAALPGTMIWNFVSGPSVLVLVPASLVEGEPRLDVHVAHDGLPGRTFERVANGARLQLERYPALLLRIPESLPAADGELTYTVLARSPGQRPAIGKIHFGRSARLDLEKPGDWKVGWRIGNNGVELEVETVVVDKEDIVCDLDATPEAVEAEIARHKEKRK